MGLNYDGETMSKRHADQNYFNRIERRNGGEFPQCKGFYPDCPENPNLLDNKCRNCPQADELKKPKLEWVDCEYCGEDTTPVAEGTKKEDIEDTKCHVCNKFNSKESIQKQRP
jgi:hypothetical protein